jgi:geranylgeranyl diphosphate synthase type I
MTKQSSSVIPGNSFASYKQAVDQALQDFFVDLPSVLPLDLSATSKDALDKLQEYTLRPGKRIRGSLACMAYDEISKRQFGSAGLKLAVALELIQSYLLIIDDVMDRSELRRGLPTVHRLYAADKRLKRDEHEAAMMAINVGLIAQHLANRLVLEAPERPDRITAALDRLHLNVMATGFGQIDDLTQQAGRPVTDEDLIRKYYLKCSYYTFINPLQTGLALAGITDSDELQKVAAFGEAAGIAFQLHDDYLGIFGDAQNTGKLNVDDIKEGKYTLLVHHAIHHAIADERAELLGMLGKSDIGEAQLRRAREVFDASNATMFVRAEAQRYADLAIERLTNIRCWNETFKGLLAELVTYAVSRTS